MLPEIIDQVREFRKKSPTCYSVQPGVDISEVLENIVRTHFYEDDYNNVTRKLFYKDEDLSYEEAIKEIETIRDEGLVHRTGRQSRRCKWNRRNIGI